jgi:hypothetical protein
MVLIAWPLLLMFMPVDPIMIQLVGFRAAVMFIPFLLIGARCEGQDWSNLSAWLTVLNISALVGAVLMYTFGLEAFYPRNQTTNLLFTTGIEGATDMHRIPAFFIHSHAFASTMVMSLPFLASSFLDLSHGFRFRMFVLVGIIAALGGIVLSANRSAVALAFFAAMIAFLTPGPRLLSGRALILLLVGGVVGYFISSQVDERMLRFRTMEDPTVVLDRFGSPIDRFGVVLDTVITYPLGNGLTGAFGVSIPYFLRDQVAIDKIIAGAEDEYSRIAATQGLPGLLLYLGFFGWVAMPRRHADYLSRFCYGMIIAYLFAAFTGSGVLSVTPTAGFVLLMMGWTTREPTSTPE